MLNNGPTFSGRTCTVAGDISIKVLRAAGGERTREPCFSGGRPMSAP